MRLGFHYHIPVTFKDGVLRMPGYLSMFVDSLAEGVDHLVCFQYEALPSELALCDTVVSSPNVSFVSLGPHLPVHRRLIGKPLQGLGVQSEIRNLDCLLIRGPSPILPSIFDVAHRQDVPCALLVVGSYVRSVGSMAQPAPKRLMAWFLAHWNKRGQKRAAKQSLVFVNSRELFQDFDGLAGKLVETRTTTLRDADVVLKLETSLKKPIVVLYSGRLDRAKGLSDISAAVLSLLKRGVDLSFEIVGWEEGPGSIADELRREFSSAGHSDRFVFHGRKAAGDELLSLYRSADIYATASRLAEGFPRTIWEAMASSTPVITTAVGSVPHFLRDEKDALLVPPKDPNTLAEAILRLCRDLELRNLLITNGVSLARENTLQKRAEEMLAGIRVWLEEQKSCRV